MYDIDNDQTPEFICVRKIDGRLQLCIVDAAKNVLEKSVPLPQFNDNYIMLRIFNTEGDDHPSEIMLQLIHHSVLVFDQNLELLWEVTEKELQSQHPRKHRIMAHSQAFYDVDNDGRDETLAGSVLLDDDGSALWVMPDLEALVKDSHSDCNLMVPLGYDLQPNLLTSTGGYCFNAQGKLLWEGKDFFSGNDFIHHGQTVLTGNLRPDIGGQEVVLYDNAHRVSDKMDRVFAADNRGNLLWKFETLTPNIQEGGFGFALGDWTGDGVDEVFVNDREKVNVISGHGEVIATLPHHLIYAMDLYGDQRTEVIVLTGIGPDMKMKIIGNYDTNKYTSKMKSSVERNNNPAIYNKIRY